jgi:drug/metabolite transporter (DMT)-like permease
MIGTGLATAGSMLGQSMASLIPILIKKVDTNLLTQTIARFLFYPLVATLLGGKLPNWSTPTLAAKGLALGGMNLAHVGASYMAFRDLPAGIAMTIFYLYPFFNLIGSKIFFGESIPVKMLPLFLLAFAGVLLVAFASEDDVAYTQEGREAPNHNRGIIMALLAALTETGIFLAVRGAPTMGGFDNINYMYIGGLILLLAGIFIFGKGDEIDTKEKSWWQLGGFNSIIGLGGTTLLFLTNHYLSTSVYSLVAFIGLATSYLFGLIFAQEKPSVRALTGTGLLLAAVSGLKFI